MPKPILQLAAAGVVGVVLWKLFAGVLFGVLFTVLKIAFVVALAFFAVWLFKRWNEKKDTPDKQAE